MGEKFGSNREVKAVIHNIKEQRLLEKSLGTLDLEESYAVKLLNLDYKTVKVRLTTFSYLHLPDYRLYN